MSSNRWMISRHARRRYYRWQEVFRFLTWKEMRNAQKMSRRKKA